MMKRTKLSRPHEAWVVVLHGQRSVWPLLSTAAAQKNISISQAEKYFGTSWNKAQALHHGQLECIKVTVS